MVVGAVVVVVVVLVGVCECGAKYEYNVCVEYMLSEYYVVRSDESIEQSTSRRELGRVR